MARACTVWSGDDPRRPPAPEIDPGHGAQQTMNTAESAALRLYEKHEVSLRAARGACRSTSIRWSRTCAR